MAMYMTQIQDMNSVLVIIKQKTEESQDKARVLSGKISQDNQGGAVNINPGSDPMSLGNTLEQATGELGQRLRWNIDKGQMEVQVGGEWRKDERGNKRYMYYRLPKDQGQRVIASSTEASSTTLSPGRAIVGVKVLSWANLPLAASSIIS